MNKYQNLFSLEGKKAIVIGGGGGIGQAIAKGLAAFGAETAIASRNQDTLNEAAAEIKAEIGVDIRTFVVDASDEADVIALAKRVKEEMGVIDILVNSQGYNRKYPMLDQPIEEWDRMFEVNIRSVMICCREFGRDMVAQKYGRIINVGSINAFRHSSTGVSSAYSTTKGAIASFTQDLAVEWAKHNVTVNMVTPILTATKMMVEILAKDPAHKKRTEERNPMGRLANPDDCIGMSVFFASDAAAFVTGQYLLPDGGLFNLM